jgi:hypothetical protein
MPAPAPRVPSSTAAARTASRRPRARRTGRAGRDDGPPRRAADAPRALALLERLVARTGRRSLRFGDSRCVSTAPEHRLGQGDRRSTPRVLPRRHGGCRGDRTPVPARCTAGLPRWRGDRRGCVRRRPGHLRRLDLQPARGRHLQGISGAARSMLYKVREAKGEPSPELLTEPWTRDKIAAACAAVETRSHPPAMLVQEHGRLRPATLDRGPDERGAAHSQLPRSGRARVRLPSGGTRRPARSAGLVQLRPLCRGTRRRTGGDLLDRLLSVNTLN